MAPLKLEDQIKERLEQRTIQPTEAAWDRIAQKLDNAQGQKKQNKALWMAIAASFVGGLLIATLFFKTSVPNAGPALVEETVPEAVERVNEQPQMVPQLIEKEAVVEKETKEGSSKQVRENAPPITKQTQRIVVKEQEAIAAASIVKQEAQINEKPFIQTAADTRVAQQEDLDPATQLKINEKLSDLLKEVAVLEQSQQVTDADIDALLIAAQREIVSKDVLLNTTEQGTTDATSLLLDVESELQTPSFKNKIFNTLKESFTVAREAVANRNN